MLKSSGAAAALTIALFATSSSAQTSGATAIPRSSARLNSKLLGTRSGKFSHT